MSKVWFVIDEKKHGDVFSRSLPEGSSREDAERELDLEWKRLTSSERKNSHVYAAYGDADEDGDPADWNFDDVVEIEDLTDPIWYAVQRTPEDAWDNGSYDLEEALEMLRNQGEGLIAVINDETKYCMEEIRYEDIED